MVRCAIVVLVISNKEGFSMLDNSLFRRLHLLATPVFVLSVALLAVNDFLLKPMFHNWFTGKLSDAAGLTAFALFICAVWPARRSVIAIATTVGFVFWKSPFSQFLIDFANSALPFTVGRTVDYSDCLVLPLVWLVSKYHPYMKPWPARQWLINSFACLGLFLFCATSYIPRYAITRLGTIPAVALSPTDTVQQDLQALFDDAASRYQLRCMVCDSLSSGRLYAENEKHAGTLSLIVNFDPEKRVLFFDVRTVGPPTGEKKPVVDSMRYELENRLRKEFPGIDLAAAQHPRRESSIQLGVRKKYSNLSYQDQKNRDDYDRAVEVISEVAAGHGMKQMAPRSTYIVYSVGRLFGPEPWDRELVMTVSIADWPLVAIDIHSFSPTYKQLQRTLATEVVNRLKAEFGAHRAWER